jgi:sugar phosphate isomerase/epimerase
MKLGLLIHYTDVDLELVRRLGLESCELLIFPDDPLSPSRGATQNEWRAARERLDALNIEVSAIGSYTNHISPDRAAAEESVSHIEKLFQLAHVMGCNTIGTFAGRDPELSIVENIPRFKRVFAPLCEKAEKAGIRIAIEGCPMFIGWPFRGINFAHTPEAWDLMFDAVPSPALGLEFDPSHLICQEIDPLWVIRNYGAKIYHAHAKDAEIVTDNLNRFGIMDRRTTRHRMPGLGSADWATIVPALIEAGYQGNLDIEGRHDPEYHGESEEAGLRIAVDALRRALPGAGEMRI